MLDLGALDAMGVADLRAAWRERIGGEPPTTRSANLLRAEIAWRLQARIEGDLDARLKRRLDQLARQRQTTAPPILGGAIVREWNGVTYRVVVVESGYLYDGQIYSSLSEIARRITGVRWSGPRFFGLVGKAR